MEDTCLCPSEERELRKNFVKAFHTWLHDIVDTISKQPGKYWIYRSPVVLHFKRPLALRRHETWGHHMAAQCFYTRNSALAAWFPNPSGRGNGDNFALDRIVFLNMDNQLGHRIEHEIRRNCSHKHPWIMVVRDCFRENVSETSAQFYSDFKFELLITMESAALPIQLGRPARLAVELGIGSDPDPVLVQTHLAEAAASTHDADPQSGYECIVPSGDDEPTLLKQEIGRA